MSVQGVKCGSCNEYCYGDIISISSKYYHQKCFLCTVRGCKEDLKDGCFFLDGNLYCRKDYHEVAGVKCSKCGRYVEGKAILARESLFHTSCFNCSSCGKTIPADDQIFYKDEDVCCQNCCRVTCLPANKISIKDEKSAFVCGGCNNHIHGQALLTLGRPWHLWCFRCEKCNIVLSGEFYIGKDGIPLCEMDYYDGCGIICAYCTEYILGKGLQAGGKYYHPTCARCNKCKEIFDEGEEMVLDDSEILHEKCSDEQHDVPAIKEHEESGYENSTAKNVGIKQAINLEDRSTLTRLVEKVRSLGNITLFANRIPPNDIQHAIIPKPSHQQNRPEETNKRVIHRDPQIVAQTFKTITRDEVNDNPPPIPPRPTGVYTARHVQEKSDTHTSN